MLLIIVLMATSGLVLKASCFFGMGAESQKNVTASYAQIGEIGYIH